MPSPPAEHEPSAARNIYAFGLTSFLNDTATEMAYWVLPAFLASLGAGPAQLGLIEGIAESVASFAKLFSGYLTDHIDRRKPVVVAGYFVANAVKPLLAVVTAWPQILLIRFSDRLAKGVRGAPRDVMVAESVPNSRLGSAYGLIQSMDSAGAIAGRWPRWSCWRASEYEACSGQRRFRERCACWWRCWESERPGMEKTQQLTHLVRRHCRTELIAVKRRTRNASIFPGRSTSFSSP